MSISNVNLKKQFFDYFIRNNNGITLEDSYFSQIQIKFNYS